MMKLMKEIFCGILMSAMFFAGCSKSETDMFGDVHGFVTNTSSGEPIRNASVTITPTGKTSVTGSDGSFQYMDLTPGQYTVQVSATGYRTNMKTIQVEPGVVSRCDIPLTAGITEVTVSPSTIDFGSSATQKNFVISNIGNNTVQWSLSHNSTWIYNISPSSGTIQANGTVTVTVNVDRSKLTDEEELALMQLTTTAGDGLSVTAKIRKGSDGGSGNTDDPNRPGQTVMNGIYAYYTFEQDAKDQTENKLNGSAVNCTYTKEGQDGSYVLSMSKAENSLLNIPYGMIDKENMSVSFWVKGINEGHIFSVTLNGSYNNMCYILYVQSNKLTYWINAISSNGSPQQFTHSTFSPDKWYMITLTSGYTNSYLGTYQTKLYIDGEYVDAVSHNIDGVSPHNKGMKFTIGGALDYSGKLSLSAISMKIDNLRVYNTRQLEVAEVRKIYDSESRNWN